MRSDSGATAGKRRTPAADRTITGIADRLSEVRFGLPHGRVDRQRSLPLPLRPPLGSGQSNVLREHATGRPLVTAYGGYRWGRFGQRKTINARVRARHRVYRDAGGQVEYRADAQ